MLLDDTIGYRQPEACPLANFLGSKEWLEDSFHGFVIDPDTCVGNGNNYVLSMRRKIIKRLRPRFDLDLPGRDGKEATLWHGITRICRQIHQNLLDLSPVCHNLQLYVGETGIEFNILSNNPFYKLAGIFDYLVNHHCLGIYRLL